MSMDLERYAELYGKFGDGDIQRLLEKAAKLSRRRGRPEIVFVDNPLAFTLREERFVREMEEHLALQKIVVGFFRHEAPRGTDKTLYDLARPFHNKVGRLLPHEVSISDLLLPARRRTTDDRQEKELLQESQSIAPKIKTAYNHVFQTCLRAGLVHVGDVRNITNLDGTVTLRSMTPYVGNFMRVAL